MRWAIASSASSDCMPSWISASTRANSLAVGSAPSLTALSIAWLNEWPAFSDAAIAISVSGSWLSNRASRCFGLELHEEHRDDEAERQRDQRRDAGEAQHQGDERAEHQAGADLDVEQLGRAQRQVGLLERRRRALPPVHRADDLLGRDEQLLQEAESRSGSLATASSCRASSGLRERLDALAEDHARLGLHQHQRRRAGRAAAASRPSARRAPAPVGSSRARVRRRRHVGAGRRRWSSPARSRRRRLELRSAAPIWTRLR